MSWKVNESYLTTYAQLWLFPTAGCKWFHVTMKHSPGHNHSVLDLQVIIYNLLSGSHDNFTREYLTQHWSWVTTQYNKTIHGDQRPIRMGHSPRKRWETVFIDWKRWLRKVVHCQLHIACTKKAVNRFPCWEFISMENNDYPCVSANH